MLALRQTVQIQEGDEYSPEIFLRKQTTVFLRRMSGGVLLQPPLEEAHAASALADRCHLRGRKRQHRIGQTGDHLANIDLNLGEHLWL